MEGDTDQEERSNQPLPDGLQQLYSQFRNQIAFELSRRDAEKNVLLELISRLTAENRVLNEQLESFKNAPSGAKDVEKDPPDQRRETSVAKDESDHSASTPDGDYAKLSAKYKDLRTTFLELNKLHTHNKAKLKDAKNQVQKWKDYTDRLIKNKGLKTKPTSSFQRGGSPPIDLPDDPASPPDNNEIPFLDTPLSRPNAPKGTAQRSPVPGDDRSREQFLNSAVPAASLPAADEPRESALTSSFKDLQQKEIGSSQPTQDEVERDVQPERDDANHESFRDDDEPEFVSERPVKRRRVKRAQETALSPERSGLYGVPIKNEPCSSPDIPHLLHQPSTMTQGLDLDVSRAIFKTPRKRRTVNDVDHEHESEEETSDLSEQEGPTQTIELETSGRTANMRLKMAQTQFPRNSSPKLLSDQTPSNQTRTKDNVNNKPGHGTGRSGVLEPISPNIRSLPSSRSTSESKRTERRRRMLEELGEEGDNIPRSLETPCKQGNQVITSPDKEEGQRRLQSLLGKDASSTPPLGLKRTPASSKGKGVERHIKQENPSTPTGGAKRKAPEMPLPGSAAAPQSEPSRHQGPSRSAPRRNDASKSSIRNRPVESLRSSDFRPNPKFNQGLDYAFSEVVRTREGRRCLPGCTRPECCGGIFRAMVDAGVPANLQRGLFESSQDDDEDDRLLRFYLGDAYSTHMPPEYRSEMLTRAKAELLANRIGKHRQAYVRQKSPPGFWRADMPDTQELENDRAQAREQERAAVQEMYREAMRDGGRWIFRDEVQD